MSDLHKWKELLFSVLLLSVIGLSACGGSSGGGGSITVTLAPANGATSVAVDAAVTATFSGAITAPADWSSVFTLILNGTGLPLCTGYTYDETTLTVTCIHADLGSSSNYTAAITGLAGVTDASSAFTTKMSVSGVSKTSVTTTSDDGSGSAILTFNLSGALPAGATPTMTVSDETISTCTVAGDSLSVSCQVTGLDGCTTYSNYTATFNVADIENYLFTFNSADDEYDTNGTIDNGCYNSNITNATVTDGMLNLDGTNQTARALKYLPVGNPDMVAVTYLSSFNTTHDGDALTFEFYTSDDNNNTGFFSLYDSVYLTTTNPVWMKIGGNQGADVASMTADIWPEAAQRASGLYFCLVNRNSSINLYLSLDGSTYTQLNSTNMTCINPGCTISDTSIAGWSRIYTGGSIFFTGSGTPILTGTLDFLRFNAAPSGDDAGDCAALTSY